MVKWTVKEKKKMEKEKRKKEKRDMPQTKYV